MNSDKSNAAEITDGLDTVQGAASFLSVGRTTVHKLMATGKLPFVKIGRSTRIRKSDLNQLIQAGLTGGWDQASGRELHGESSAALQVIGNNGVAKGDCHDIAIADAVCEPAYRPWVRK